MAPSALHQFGDAFPGRAVYNAIWQLVAEYSTQIETVKPQVCYLTTDHLGSPRVLTNKQGEVVSRRDFMPFGEEIVAMAETHRTPGDKYGVGDGVRQKFTGYERDEETGLDFAEARYYYNNHGRFTAVDPLLASGKSANPQTFNRYAYTMNRPLILTDPTGLQAGTLKRNFGIRGFTYQPVYGKENIARHEKTPDGPTVEKTITRTVEVGRENVVMVSSEVNGILNQYASAVYANEVNANAAIGAINEASGSATVKSVTLGTSIDFGLTGENAGSSSAGASASMTIDVTDTSNLDAQRRTADTLLGVDAANALRNTQTVATGSPDTPRNLTTSEINGLLQSAQNIAREAARRDVAEQEKRRRESETVIPPRE